MEEEEVYDFYKYHEIILQKKKYHKNGISGLINTGNKCFMNSIIQCLSNTLKLTDYFLSMKFKEDDPDFKNKQKSEYELVISYINLLVNIWDKNQLLKPKTFNHTFSKFIKQYSTCEQQDSHECLVYLLDILHKGLSYEIELEITGEVKTETDKLTELSLNTWKQFYKTEYSYINKIFHGMTVSNIDCKNCNIQDIIFEPYNTLSIDVNSTSLINCMKTFFQRDESIPSWKCEKCNHQGCSKTCNSWTFPNYLIIHLKRFTSNGQKIDTHVNYPIENLNLTQFIDSRKGDPNNYIYSLYAVNYHSGDLNSGHYWSSCKNLDNSWYLFNDGDTSLCNNICTKDAYILFYYRKYISK